MQLFHRQEGSVPAVRHVNRVRSKVFLKRRKKFEGRNFVRCLCGFHLRLPHRLVSLVTREAADELGLATGKKVICVVKSTDVMIEVPS